MNSKKQPANAIEVRGLAKRFGDVQAVAGIDFAVRDGELFGFLGPNGAGKSTTINMLIGLARPDPPSPRLRRASAGTIRIGGIDCSTNPKAAQHLMGVVPDESNLYPELTGFDNLCFCGALYGMDRRDRETRAQDLLDRFDLAKTAGAILFGVANAFVPVIFAAFLMDLSGINWATLIPAIVLIAISSTFLGLFIAVSVSEVFEAQTFSNFFRFPMLFLCGLFFPIEQLPVWLRPLSYVLPLTYGADVLHGSIHRGPHLQLTLNFGMLIMFCILLFAFSLRNVRQKWIV